MYRCKNPCRHCQKKFACRSWLHLFSGMFEVEMLIKKGKVGGASTRDILVEHVLRKQPCLIYSNCKLYSEDIGLFLAKYCFALTKGEQPLLDYEHYLVTTVVCSFLSLFAFYSLVNPLWAFGLWIRKKCEFPRSAHICGSKIWIDTFFLQKNWYFFIYFGGDHLFRKSIFFKSIKGEKKVFDWII